jgi:hypothetical protein
MIIDEQSYLAHYGVKGQKWGVRRKLKKAGNKFLDDLDLPGRENRRSNRISVEQQRKEKRAARIEFAVKAAPVVLMGGIFAVKVIRELNGAKTPRPQLKVHQGESDKWLRQNFIPNNGKTPVSSLKLKTPVKSEANFMKSMTKKHNANAVIENARLRKWYDEFQIPLPQREFVELWPE